MSTILTFKNFQYIKKVAAHSEKLLLPKGRLSLWFLQSLRHKTVNAVLSPNRHPETHFSRLQTHASSVELACAWRTALDTNSPRTFNSQNPLV